MAWLNVILGSVGKTGNKNQLQKLYITNPQESELYRMAMPKMIAAMIAVMMNVIDLFLV